MTATLLLGPAASGKTEACLQRILITRKSQPRTPIWVILPNRAQVVAFRRRFAKLGGGLGVRIETMEAFVEELSIRLGCQRPRAGSAIRRRMVQASLHEMDRRGLLPHYSSIVQTAGLSHVLSERFLELKRAGWQPAELVEALAEEDQPLREIAGAFTRYQDQLETLGWEDDQGLAQRVASQLNGEASSVENLALVVVDGFDSFSANQVRLLVGLAEVDAELLITLPARSAASDHEFPRFLEARDALVEAIPDLRVQTCNHGQAMAPAITSLADGLFQRQNNDPRPGQGTIEWLKARSVHAEVREALRWIKAAKVRTGVPLESCALILTEPESYEPFVRQTAEEFGIPLRFGLGRQLHKAPSMVALLDLLRLPPSNWSRRLTLEAIRSPFFDLSSFQLEPTVASQLEVVSYWGQVVEGIDQWTEALRALSRRTNPQEVEAFESLSAPLPGAESAAKLLDGLQAFADRMNPGRARPLAEWVIWLEDLLQEFDFFERARPAEEQAAALRLREVLRAMLLSHAVIGDQSQEYTAFLADLEAMLERARYQPKLEWQQSYLQVEGIQSARGLRFQVAAIVGLSEGQLPEVEREDPFLGEDIRSSLGLEPRIGQDQQSFFYSAITRADDSLLMTRPTLADDGELWEPSPYWLESLRIFGREEGSIPLLQNGADRLMTEAASPQEISFLAVRRGSLPAAFRSLESRLEPLRKARGLIQARLADNASGVFEGELKELSSGFEEHFNSEYLWSPSRLESYGTCPHYFLVTQLLGLEQLEEPTLGPDARQLGTLLHELLEQAYQAAQDPSDPQLVLEQLREVAGQKFDQAPQEFGFRPSPLWQIEAEHFMHSLEDSVLGLAEEGEGWQPFGYEATFGLGQAPALSIETESGPVKVRGIIDRLDRKGDDLRVIDYKTGSSHLAAADLVRGRRLQLPLYALAAEQALAAGNITDGFYWAILSAKAGSLRLARFSFTGDGEEEGLKGPAGAYAALRGHLSRFLNSIRSGQFQPRPPQGGCPRYCPAANWCWRYSPGYQR